MAQTRKDGGRQAGPQRLRALHDDRFAEPNARLQPGAAGRPLAVATAAVRAARFPVAPANRLPELPNATRGTQPVFRQVTAVTATDHRHAFVVVIAVHVVVTGVRHRPQDLVHSGAQAQGQGTRRVHHERNANGLNRDNRNAPILPQQVMHLRRVLGVSDILYRLQLIIM